MTNAGTHTERRTALFIVFMIASFSKTTAGYPCAQAGVHDEDFRISPSGKSSTLRVDDQYGSRL
ncbi:hypothetical protein [Paraburkholderia tuberum]|uniref:hypothetical protein n=1 Tax=Paraburkholderia sp. WC7.3d TaxID=2991069 RepID=UPI00037E1ED4